MSEQSRRAADRRLAAISDRYCEALCAADAQMAETVVAGALGAGVAATTIQVQVIAAAMRRIGELWEKGELTIADEHVATGLSYRALLPLQEPFADRAAALARACGARRRHCPYPPESRKTSVMSQTLTITPNAGGTHADVASIVIQRLG